MANAPTYESIDLADLLLKRHRTVNVNLGDGLGIAVHWQPDKLSEAVFLEMQETFGGDKPVTNPFVIARKFIVPVLDAWSLTDKGQPLPISEETVGGLGLVICNRIGSELMADFQKVMTPEEIADTKKASAA